MMFACPFPATYRRAGVFNSLTMPSDRLTARDHKFIKQYGIYCWAKAVRLLHDDNEEEGPDLDYSEPERPPVIKDNLPNPYGWKLNQ